MNRSLRRIWGFGAVGWALLPLLAFLMYCAFGGFDLTFALLRWWYEAMGWGWLRWLVANPALYYSWSLMSTLFGPISLTYLLLSLYLAPRRWHWSVWCLAVAWTLAQPALWWRLAGGWSSGGLLERVFGTVHSNTASAAILALGTALGLWFMTRSRRVIAVFAGVTVAAVACEAFLQGSSTVSHLYVLQTIWHCVVGTILVGWALIERRHALRQTGLCLDCGYNLAGIATAICPECGAPVRSGEQVRSPLALKTPDSHPSMDFDSGNP